MAKQKEPKIDKEFEAFLPYCSPEERSELRKSIVDDGIREPLIVWEETGILVDGHRRYDIATELKMKYRYEVRSFKDREEVLAWMAANQLMRRNLTDEQRSYYRAKEYLNAKKNKAENLPKTPSDDLPKAQNELLANTAENIGKKHNVSAATIKRDVAFAKAVDVSPDKDKILAGTSGKTKAEVIKSAPLFCDRCTRISPVKKCPMCAELRKSKKKPKKLKSGQAVYDWSAAEKAIGVVVRIPDAIAKGYPSENKGEDHKQAILLLEPFVEHMADWKKKLLKEIGNGEKDS